MRHHDLTHHHCHLFFLQSDYQEADQITRDGLIYIAGESVSNRRRWHRRRRHHYHQRRQR